jgi:hypothetical protein
MCNESISSQIKNDIIAGGVGKLYVARDFAKYLNDDLVSTVLLRLEKSGLLVRVAQGIYLYPERTRFGIAYPSLFTIASTIAERDNATILPTGDTALNQLGLSTQVPTNEVYLTTGSPRMVKVGKRTIRFKQSAPKNFSYKSRLMPLIVFSFKDLGEKNIDESVLSKIEKIIINSPEKELVKEDMALAPLWIRKVLLPIIRKI